MISIQINFHEIDKNYYLQNIYKYITKKFHHRIIQTEEWEGVRRRANQPLRAQDSADVSNALSRPRSPARRIKLPGPRGSLRPGPRGQGHGTPATRNRSTQNGFQV